MLPIVEGQVETVLSWINEQVIHAIGKGGRNEKVQGIQVEQG
jgi:hypothetical protein